MKSKSIENTEDDPYSREISLSHDELPLDESLSNLNAIELNPDLGKDKYHTFVSKENKQLEGRKEKTSESNKLRNIHLDDLICELEKIQNQKKANSSQGTVAKNSFKDKKIENYNSYKNGRNRFPPYKLSSQGRGREYNKVISHSRAYSTNFPKYSNY